MNYRLYEYLERLDGIVVKKSIKGDCDISHVSYDSNDVRENTLFICKGMHFREEYLLSAIEKGAVCYVSEKEYNVECDCIIVSDIRSAIAILANFYYGEAWRNLKTIGITGTKGKSTTAYFVKYILDEHLKTMGKGESAIISSIDTYDGVERFESHLTTPEPLELHKHFKNACDSNIEYLTMEVSSQALKYERVGGVTFDIGCFLNIGDDHISDIEHKDADDYFYSKMKIFEHCKTACINLDSARISEVLECAKKAEKVITFSRNEKHADIYAYNIKKIGNDTVFTVRTPKFESDFTLTIPGLFNVENALCAIAVCYSLGISQNSMYVGLMKARSSGRMEIYTNSDNKIVVIVDYAHNRMSFENLFDSVKKEFPNRRIVSIFGCPGYKALMRRKDLGEVAGANCDKVFITEEDCGEEPLLDICNEIAQHVKSKNCPYEIIENRGDAIRSAIFECDSETVILLTGKGNETRQKRGTQYVPCPSDVEYTLKYLKEYDVMHNTDTEEKIDSFQEILPKLHKLNKKTIVIKLGGSVLEDSKKRANILEDIAMLNMVGANVVIVHGGGKKITKTLSDMGLGTEFKNGYRVTKEEDIEVVEMALSGNVNKKIVRELIKNNINAVGISGVDGGTLIAEKRLIDGEDYGYIGRIKSVNPDLITNLTESGIVPVVSPVSADNKGNVYNVNADDAAFALAEGLKADKLIFITDVNGILLDVNNSKTAVTHINAEKAKELIEKGFVGEGMIPKLKNCLNAIENGVKNVVILNGNIKNNLVSDFISEKKNSTTISKE